VSPAPAVLNHAGAYIQYSTVYCTGGGRELYMLDNGHTYVSPAPAVFNHAGAYSILYTVQEADVNCTCWTMDVTTYLSAPAPSCNNGHWRRT
jgi:hypothetical protein